MYRVVSLHFCVFRPHCHLWRKTFLCLNVCLPHSNRRARTNVCCLSPQALSCLSFISLCHVCPPCVSFLSVKCVCLSRLSCQHHHVYLPTVTYLIDYVCGYDCRLWNLVAIGLRRPRWTLLNWRNAIKTWKMVSAFPQTNLF